MLFRSCAQLHRCAANTLLHLYQGHEGEVATGITFHLAKGGGEAAQIALYAEIAAHKAYSLAAYVEAEHYYWQAVQILSHHALPLENAIDDTTLRELSSTPTDTFDVLHVARLLERIGECCTVQGNYEEARHIYECILALRQHRQAQLPECERKREAQIQALIWREIGRTWISTGDYEQADECSIHGKQVLSEADVTTGAAWACIHLQQGTWLCIEGAYDDARRHAREALEMLEQAMRENGVEQSGQVQRISPLEVGKGPEARMPQVLPRQAAQQKSKTDDSTFSPLQFETRTERAIVGDALEVGRAHELLGIISASEGNTTEGLDHMYTALSIFEQHDLVIAMVKVCGNLGAVHASRSENAIANTYLRRTLDLAERMGNLPNMAFATGNLGEMASRSGNVVEAENWFRRSISISERTNEREHTSWCNVALAGALQDQGNLTGAAESIYRALTVARSIKSARCSGAALVALADLRVSQAIGTNYLEEGVQSEKVPISSARAIRLILRARSTVQHAISIEGLEMELVVEGHFVLANIYYLLGNMEDARLEALKTIDIAAQYEVTRMAARSQRLLGRILAVQGDYAQADTYFEQSLQTFREYEQRLDYARAVHGYAVSLLNRSKPGNAHYQRGLDCLHEARTAFADCHASLDLEWVENTLKQYEPQVIG